MEKISNRQPEKRNEQDKERSKKISEALKGIIAKGLIILSPLWAGSKEENIIDDAPTKPKDTTEQQAPSDKNPSIPNTELKPKEEIKEEDLKIYEFCEKYIDEANNASKLPKEAELPPQLLLAMALLESGYGESELAREANNFFGNIATEEEWQGEVYEKLTTEYIDKDKRVKYEKEPGYKFLEDKGDKLKVEYFREFRKYPDAQASFNDTATNKIFFKKNDGTYRYKEAVEYLMSGGKDAKRVAELIGPNSEGRSAWASDPEWTEKVKNIIGRIDSICVLNDLQIDEDTSEVAPETSNVIDIGKIDFSILDEPRDKPLIERMKAGFSEITLEDFQNYRSGGIKAVSTQHIEDLIRPVAPNKGKINEEEIDKEIEEYIGKYNKDLDGEYKFLIIHLMANGVDESTKDDPNNLNKDVPRGNSAKTDVPDGIIKSWWRRGDGTSVQYMMTDDDNAMVFQCSPTKFESGANHIIRIEDEGEEGRDANNKNSIGIEVQADTVYSITESQFKNLTYWAADILIESGKVNKEMSDSEIDEIVDYTVIGHGKTSPGEKESGLEFGYKYSRPFINALQQLVKAELKR